jgi:hypothetical protein
MDHMYKLVLTHPTSQPIMEFGKLVNCSVTALLAQHGYVVTNYSQWLLRVHNIAPKDTAIIHTLQEQSLERWLLSPVGWLDDYDEFTIEDYVFGRYTFGEYHG